MVMAGFVVPGLGVGGACGQRHGGRGGHQCNGLHRLLLETETRLSGAPPL